MWRLLCAVSKLATGAELAVSCREKPALWGPEEPCPVLAAPPLGLYDQNGSCGGRAAVVLTFLCGRLCILCRPSPLSRREVTSESLGDAGVVDDLAVSDCERCPLPHLHAQRPGTANVKLPQVRVLRRVITNEVGEPPDPMV